MSSHGRFIGRIVLALGVLALGVSTFVLFVRAKPSTQKKPRMPRGALVEVRPVRQTDEAILILAQGTVMPSRQVVLQPEITGRVVWQSQNLLPGGRFKKGEPLLRIDPSDYRLSLKQQAAAIRSVEAELRIEQSRQQVAEREWEIINEDAAATPEGRAVALRQPQREAVQASLERARAAHEQAALALGRSMISAPFNGFIKVESVDIGQLVTPAVQLGTLVGSDEFWVQVSVPVEKLKWLRVPGMNAKADEGSEAKVKQLLGTDSIERRGKVLRLLGDLDPVGGMARLLIAVGDPLALLRSDTAATSTSPHGTLAKAPGAAEASHQAEGGQQANAADSTIGTRANNSAGADAYRLPLLLGAYVEVAIESESLQAVIEVPRRALQEGNQVYIYTPAGKLEIREVEILWRRADSVLISRGLSEGERVIISRVPGAVSGMPLRVSDGQNAQEAGK